MRTWRRGPDAVDLRWQHRRGEIQNVHVQIRSRFGVQIDGKDIPAFLAEGSADGPGAGEELKKKGLYLLWVF